MPDAQHAFAIRFATEADCPLILRFIKALAAYEKMSDEVVATEDGLRDSLFAKRQAEVLIGEEDGKPVAFALFFHNFSTFLGKAGLYLEDLYVDESARGRGYGKAMLRRLAAIAKDRGCQRLDWWCLNWNQSSVDFYLALGATPMDDWTVYRLQGDALAALAENG